MPGCIAVHSRDAQVGGSCRLRLMKANGAGLVSAAVKGTDYVAPGATMKALGASPTATNSPTYSPTATPSFTITNSSRGPATQAIKSFEERLFRKIRV